MSYNIKLKDFRRGHTSFGRKGPKAHPKTQLKSLSPVKTELPDYRPVGPATQRQLHPPLGRVEPLDHQQVPRGRGPGELEVLSRPLPQEGPAFTVRPESEGVVLPEGACERLLPPEREHVEEGAAVAGNLVQVEALHLAGGVLEGAVVDATHGCRNDGKPVGALVEFDCALYWTYCQISKK